MSNWPQKEKPLYGLYAKKKGVDDWIFLQNIQDVSLDKARNIFCEHWLKLPEDIKGLYELLMIKEVKKSANLRSKNPLEIPRNRRLEVFGDDIIFDYEDGSVLLELKDKYRVSVDSIRKHLKDNNITIRKRGQKKKK